MIDLIRSVSITQKNTTLYGKRQYSFTVDLRVTKPQIKALLEEFYDVEIIAVNTHILPRKQYSRGRSKGLRTRYKKAIVTLQVKERLPIFR